MAAWFLIVVPSAFVAGFWFGLLVYPALSVDGNDSATQEKEAD